MAGQAEPGPAAVRGDVDRAERGEELLALPFVLQDLLQSAEQLRRRQSPANVNARQAMRSSTPSAASSGPWPQTSPIIAWTVPSGVRTVS